MVCGECGKTLRRDNTIGYCREHRKLSETRQAYNRDYYQRNQPDLVAYAAQYREEHADEHRAASLRWEQTNPDRKRANDAAYRDRNRERLREEGREASKRSRAKHAVTRRARSRARYAEDPAKSLAATARWYAEHPEARAAHNALRRQRVNRVPLTREDKQIAMAYRRAIRDDPCYYCGGTGQEDDHFFPLAKGGTDHWWNLIRACRRCNRSKRATCGTAFLLAA